MVVGLQRFVDWTGRESQAPLKALQTAEQFSKAYFQGVCQNFDCVQARIRTASLDAGHVGAGKAAVIREFLLGQTARKPKLTNATTEANTQGRVVCHSRMVRECDLIVNTLIVTLVCFFWVCLPHQRAQGMTMKKMLAGIFIAASAAPLVLIAGGLAFRHMLGGFPNAMEIAINTAACLLGGGLFVFMAGLVSRGNAPKPVQRGEGWMEK